MKKGIIVKLLYALALLSFLLYSITKYSEFMFFGGVFLIIASTLFIIGKMSKK